MVDDTERQISESCRVPIGTYSPSWEQLGNDMATLASMKESTHHCSFRQVSGPPSKIKLEYKEVYKDEYTNEILPTAQIQEAIMDELNYFCEHVWRGCTIQEAHQVPDSKIIPSRWVLCNKGDIETPDVRARLVGCEINTYQDDSFYASTPPLEAKRMLLSEFASRRFQDGHPLKLSFVDIRKAYFNEVPKRALFVRLPKEMGLGPNAVARLDRCMYGTRDAAGIWESCYSDCLASLGFKPGRPLHAAPFMNSGE